jgi:hypothetical protein
VLALIGVASIAAVAWPDGEPGCSWNERDVGEHRDALLATPAALAEVIAAGTATWGDAEIIDETVADSTEDLTGAAFPMACVDIGSHVVAEPRHGGVSLVVLDSSLAAFSSWDALDRYIDEASSVAARELDVAPDGFSAGQASPYDNRVESIAGRQGWDLYCLSATASRCELWNLLARSQSCRSILIDVDLALGRGEEIEESEATEILLTVADTVMAQVEGELENVPCSTYSGQPSGRSWRPAS